MASSAARLRPTRPSLGAIAGSLLAGAAAMVMASPLKDNSFLTHLATGRIILDTGRVPSSDPYSYTAPGEPWVVQSWLASWLYATLEAVGGLGLVRVAFALTGTLLMGMVWVLLRPVESLVIRFAVGALFLVAASGAWSQRPLMFGLVGFAAVALVSEGRLAAWWLLPTGWVWVNTHGSFPMALVFLVARWIGARLDGEPAVLEVRAAKWALAGFVSGVLGPLGVRALMFPVQLLGRQEVLSDVVEWRAPEFTSMSERGFLLMVVLAVLALSMHSRFRHSLPSVVFVAAALAGSRNIGLASIVLVLTIGLAAPGFGSLRSTDRPRGAPIALAAVLLVAALTTVGRLQTRDLDLRAYPVAALAVVEQRDVDLQRHRLAAREMVGNLMGYVYGPEGVVFFDDRFDMYPASLNHAALALSRGEPPMLSEIDEWGVDLVLTPTSSAASSVLARDPAWQVSLISEQWQLACRRATLDDPARRIC